MKVGELYWSVVEPVWDDIDIYEGPERFLQTFNDAPKHAALLFAAHFCQSEICNGGFQQFFFNNTGVLAPEAIQAFRALGMGHVADIVQKASERLASPYPRDRVERQDMLETLPSEFFDDLNQQFYKRIEEENGGFREAADAYAKRALN